MCFCVKAYIIFTQIYLCEWIRELLPSWTMKLCIIIKDVKIVKVRRVSFIMQKKKRHEKETFFCDLLLLVYDLM